MFSVRIDHGAPKDGRWTRDSEPLLDALLNREPSWALDPAILNEFVEWSNPSDKRKFIDKWLINRERREFRDGLENLATSPLPGSRGAREILEFVRNEPLLTSIECGLSMDTESFRELAPTALCFGNPFQTSTTANIIRATGVFLKGLAMQGNWDLVEQLGNLIPPEAMDTFIRMECTPDLEAFEASRCHKYLIILKIRTDN